MGDLEAVEVDDKKRVLLVDDEDAIRMLLRDVLQGRQVEIFEASNGIDALHYIRNEEIDLVVSDLQMPGMSGVDLLEEIRRRFPSLPVLIITGKPTLDAAVECMKCGAIDFLTKPFDIVEFRDMVRNALADNDRLMQEQQESRRYHSLHQLAGYNLNGLLGEGTSGVVFRAERGGQSFALKVFKFATVTEVRREEMRRRFTRESQFLSSISHENIVRLEEFGFSDEKIPYIVMEFIDGCSLKKYIQEDSLSIQDKLKMIRQVVLAAGYIHEKQVVHRDIKPDNIMIVEDTQRVVLTDFGIIKSPDSDLTMVAHIMGSPAYLAPEGFSSAHVDHRCDIFAIGVVLYELLLGRRPFLADDLFSMAAMVQTELPPKPSSLDADITPELDDLLARALRKEPAERIQTCAEFLQLLDHALDPKHAVKPDLPALSGEDWS